MKNSIVCDIWREWMRNVKEEKEEGTQRDI